MDGFTPLEYHIDERMEMENSDMKVTQTNNTSLHTP